MSEERQRVLGSIERLYQSSGMERLQQAQVTIIGLGGVGSWAAEALARSGVGRLHLVDMDHIAPSNINRQVHALTGTLGQAKCEAMRARIHEMHAFCEVTVVDDFLTPDNLPQVISPHTQMVIDCTDDVAAKVALILYARQHKIPLIVCGGAGGKTDMLRLQQTDLVFVKNDALLAKVRSVLRRENGYPKGRTHGKMEKLRIQCLWIDQPAAHPFTQQKQPLQGLSCAGYGSIVTVTASMGLAAAQYAITAIV